MEPLHWLWLAEQDLVGGELLEGCPELLVGIGAEEIAQVAMDGRRIVLSRVVPGFENPLGARADFFGKGEDLEAVAVEGEKILVDESVSRTGFL